MIRFMENHAKQAPLSATAQIMLGHPFRGAIPSVPGGSTNVLQLRDITPSGRLACDNLVTTELQGRKSPDWLRNQDIVFVARGDNTFAALVADPPPRTVCSPHLYIIRVNQPDAILPAFLAWQLNQTPAQRYLRQSAEGSNQLSIRRSVLGMTPIRIPPLARQHAIIALDRAAQAERRALHALIKNRDTELAILAERLLA
ncbi:restriction endonuclease subunit S [Xanthomonas translucens]|uniref:restriction endonuclease subunit S n=1 Tax=Xanthomonas campestris pv. translucens TaxID=343 RepID=UPI001F224A51|nr:restriction endonuclease subunit S [Xanthomonas translucens]